MIRHWAHESDFMGVVGAGLPLKGELLVRVHCQAMKLASRVICEDAENGGFEILPSREYF